jgi:hypothetical protein
VPSHTTFGSSSEVPEFQWPNFPIAAWPNTGFSGPEDLEDKRQALLGSFRRSHTETALGPDLPRAFVSFSLTNQPLIVTLTNSVNIGTRGKLV